MHDCRFGLVRPKSNADYWQNKRLSNVERDKKHIAALEEAGWNVLIVWECEVKSPEKLSEKFRGFLSKL